MENCDKYRFDEKMFHVKHFCKVVLFLTIILFYKNVNVYAATLNIDGLLQSDVYKTLFWYYDSSWERWNLITCYGNNSGNVRVDYVNNGIKIYNNFTAYFTNTGQEPINSGNLNYFSSSGYDSGSSFSTTLNNIVVIKGNVNGSVNVDDDYFKIPWYKNIWGTFIDKLGNAGAWIYTQANNLGKIIKNWWFPITEKPDNTPGSGTAGHRFVKATPIPAPYETTVFPTLSPIPTLSPTPLPTPIPVTTVIKDDGNGNSTIMYVYTNPEGTPTESPYNPNGNTYNNYVNTNNNVNTNNEVYVKDGSSPNWQDIIGYDEENNTSISFNIGDLDNNTDMFTVPLQETASDVGEAVSGFGSLPDEILLIIGCIACIPLIAGIIGRLLK